MIAAQLGTSAVRCQQGAREHREHSCHWRKSAWGDRQWRAVENKWGKETILMLSIGADVCRTAGNDLLAFKTNGETEVSEPRVDLPEPCKGFSCPQSSPPSQKYPHINPPTTTWPIQGLGGKIRTPCCPFCFLLFILGWPPALMSFSASNPPGCCHHHIWPLISPCRCLRASAVCVPGCG